MALLKHLNQAKDDRIQAKLIRQQVHDKNWIEKPVTVNPVMDKILPEEKTINFYQLTLGGTAKDNQFSKLSET